MVSWGFVIPLGMSTNSDIEVTIKVPYAIPLGVATNSDLEMII